MATFHGPIARTPNRPLQPAGAPPGVRRRPREGDAEASPGAKYARLGGLVQRLFWDAPSSTMPARPDRGLATSVEQVARLAVDAGSSEPRGPGAPGAPAAFGRVFDRVFDGGFDGVFDRVFDKVFDRLFDAAPAEPSAAGEAPRALPGPPAAPAVAEVRGPRQIAPAHGDPEEVFDSFDCAWRESLRLEEFFPDFARLRERWTLALKACEGAVEKFEGRRNEAPSLHLQQRHERTRDLWQSRLDFLQNEDDGPASALEREGFEGPWDALGDTL